MSSVLTRFQRAVAASEAFALRWVYGLAAIGFPITYGGNAVIGWRYYGDPAFYYWTPGMSIREQTIRAWTEFGAPNAALFAFAFLALAAWTVYVTPSEERVSELEAAWMDDPASEGASDGV